MELKKRLLEEIKVAMKAQDPIRLSTLRFLHAEIKNKEIDHRRELTDDEFIAILTSQIKKRKEAIGFYEKGGRQDLVDQNLKEIALIEAYLPAQVSEEDIRKRVAALIQETGIKDLKEMGKLMKVLMPEFKGKADGNLVKNLATELLSK
jgi:hypothetical protein